MSAQTQTMSERFLTAVNSDNPETGSEHSRIDGEVPAAQDAALQRQRPRRYKSTGLRAKRPGSGAAAVRIPQRIEAALRQLGGVGRDDQ